MMNKQRILQVIGLAAVAAVVELGFFAVLGLFASDYFAMVFPLPLWYGFYFVVSLIGWGFGLVIWPFVYATWLQKLFPTSQAVAHKTERWVCLAIVVIFLVLLAANPLFLMSKKFIALLIIFMSYYCCQQLRGKLG